MSPHKYTSIYTPLFRLDGNFKTLCFTSRIKTQRDVFDLKKLPLSTCRLIGCLQLIFSAAVQIHKTFTSGMYKMHVTFHVLLENHQAECRLRPVGVKMSVRHRRLQVMTWHVEAILPEHVLITTSTFLCARSLCKSVLCSYICSTQP
jgi:hypothetical protein